MAALTMLSTRKRRPQANRSCTKSSDQPALGFASTRIGAGMPTARRWDCHQQTESGSSRRLALLTALSFPPAIALGRRASEWTHKGRSNLLSWRTVLFENRVRFSGRCASMQNEQGDAMPTYLDGNGIVEPALGVEGVGAPTRDLHQRRSGTAHRLADGTCRASRRVTEMIACAQERGTSKTNPSAGVPHHDKTALAAE